MKSFHQFISEATAAADQVNDLDFRQTVTGVGMIGELMNSLPKLKEES